MPRSSHNVGVTCCAVNEVRRLRCDARGDTVPGSEPNPEKESRRALLQWTERQLYSAQSKHHQDIMAFHDFFPKMCKMGQAETVAPAVQNILGEIADSLELVRLCTFCFTIRPRTSRTFTCISPAHPEFAHHLLRARMMILTVSRSRLTGLD